jgi:SNF2 family DNA or RNA helicase
MILTYAFPQDLLPLLKGELLHHQLQGVKWLASLYASGLGGIISDEVDKDRRVCANVLVL